MRSSINLADFGPTVTLDLSNRASSEIKVSVEDIVRLQVILNEEGEPTVVLDTASGQVKSSLSIMLSILRDDQLRTIVPVIYQFAGAAGGHCDVLDWLLACGGCALGEILGCAACARCILEFLII